MTAVPAPDPATERFRVFIARRFGLHFEEGRTGFLAELAQRHATLAGLRLPEYLTWLERTPDDAEIERLAVDLTVPETYFFRHLDQLRIVTEVVLPEWRAARAAAPIAALPPFRILCVGCASGEEPYALAMLIRSELPELAGQVRILAVDLNVDMLNKARGGRYTEWALRETPLDMRRRWFHAVGRDFLLDEAIRGAVSFRQVNLAHANPDLWVDHAYELIFCRNVLMYFTREKARDIVMNISRSLVAGGYLFLGHADTLHGLSERFSLRGHKDAFYYRLDGPTAGAPRAADVGSRAPAAMPRIRVAVPRIAPGASSTAQSTAPSREPASLPSARHEPLRIAQELMALDQFAAALDVLDSAPPAQSGDVGARALRAVLCMQQGRVEEAETQCHVLLAEDEHNAGMHHLLALCRASVRDLDAAITHDCKAMQLDPRFAMPRLRLGLMACRAGRFESGRRHLTEAAQLLEQESEQRILWFGGGFGRDALIAMCRRHLEQEPKS